MNYKEKREILDIIGMVFNETQYYALRNLINHIEVLEDRIKVLENHNFHWDDDY